ncbi:MAG TPA: hypothetical protein VGD39_04310 [Nocardioides sp.]
METTLTPAARRLALAMTALVATDALGGVLAVTNDVNTWGSAWSADALLAAPLPMIAAQVLCTVLAVRSGRRWAAVPAHLLALACFVSVISGFFDGGLANDALSGPLVAFQAVLLAVTGVVGAAAVLRGRELQRSRIAATA